MSFFESSRSRFLVPTALCLLCLCLSACKQEKPGTSVQGANQSLKVVVTLPPIADFVERIAGEHAAIEILVGPGQAEHNYEPTPKQVTALSECDVFFRVGMAFEEPLLAKIKSLKPNLKVVDLREGVKLRKYLENEIICGEVVADQYAGANPTPADEAHDHHDHDHTDHAVGAPDAHHWMDPQIVMRQIESMTQVLAQLDKAHAETYTANAAQFQSELKALHTDLTTLLAPFHGREFIVFHPAYGYFADAYGLTQVAIEYEGKEPSAQQLAHLVERAKKAKLAAIFVQPQYPSKGAEVIAEAIGAEVVMVDPLPRDYLSEIQALGYKLVAAYSKNAPPARATQPVSGPPVSPEEGAAPTQP